VTTPGTDQDRLDRIDRWLRWLVGGLFAVMLALIFVAAAVFGTIVEFHAGEGLLIGATCGAGVAMGFAFGWMAHAFINRMR